MGSIIGRTGFRHLTPGPSPSTADGEGRALRFPSPPSTAGGEGRSGAGGKDGGTGAGETALPVSRPEGEETATASGEAAWTCARFRVAQKGKLTTEWEPIAVTIADATGNRWTPPVTSHSRHAGEQRFCFRSALWPDEAAWKLQVKLSRKRGFAPEEMWTVRGLAVPGPRRVAAADLTTTLPLRGPARGATLYLLGTAGPKAHMPGGAGWEPDHPSVHVRLTAPDGALRLVLVRAMDDVARVIPPGKAHYGGSGRYSFVLKTAAGAKRVDLTFALQKDRFVEFVAKPGRV